MLFKYCWIKLFVLEIFQSSNRIVCLDFLYQDNLVCNEYLVSGTKYNVPDEQLNASSQYDKAKWGRLNTVYVKDEHIGGWEADRNDHPPHYIEVRFNELSIIQAIATQGRNITGDSVTTERYVTKYKVYYRLNDTGLWAPVRGEKGQEPMVFQGNNDSNSIHTNKLPCAVQALAVRILVIESRSYPSMRFDVRGCPVSQVNLTPDCDFEDGFCGWKQEYDNESVNWEIKSGATSASKLLKLHDHTRKHETGLFAYLKSISSSDGSRRNRSAQLVTMIWRSNSTRCLHLWYSGSDPSFGLLTLYVIGCDNKSEQYIAKQVRDVTQEWNHVSLDVSCKDYMLIIGGTVRCEDEGYLAIDDISLMKGYCSEDIDHMTSPKYQDQNIETASMHIPSTEYVVYVILGTAGTGLIVGVLLCLLKKHILCPGLSGVSNNNHNAHSDIDGRNEGATLSQLYWTIGTNTRGEFSTVLERDINVKLVEFIEPAHTDLVQSAEDINISHQNLEMFKAHALPLHSGTLKMQSPYLDYVEPEENIDPIPPIRMRKSEDLDLMSSDPVECNDYIHLIPSDPMSVEGYIDYIPSHSMKVNEYLDLISPEPVQYNQYIYPVPSDSLDLDGYLNPTTSSFRGRDRSVDLIISHPGEHHDPIPFGIMESDMYIDTIYTDPVEIGECIDSSHSDAMDSDIYNDTMSSDPVDIDVCIDSSHPDDMEHDVYIHSSIVYSPEPDA